MLAHRLRRFPRIRPALYAGVSAMLVYLQTRGVGPMMGWCWAIVFDAGPAITQHWPNASCLLWCVPCWWQYQVWWWHRRHAHTVTSQNPRRTYTLDTAGSSSSRHPDTASVHPESSLRGRPNSILTPGSHPVGWIYTLTPRGHPQGYPWPPAA